MALELKPPLIHGRGDLRLPVQTCTRPGKMRVIYYMIIFNNRYMYTSLIKCGLTTNTALGSNFLILINLSQLYDILIVFSHTFMEEILSIMFHIVFQLVLVIKARQSKHALWSNPPPTHTHTPHHTPTPPNRAGKRTQTMSCVRRPLWRRQCASMPVKHDISQRNLSIYCVSCCAFALFADN